MGSFRHPKVYDSVTMRSMRATFYDILEEMDDQFLLSADPRRLKADIVERLLVLAIDGTPQNEWKEKVLRSLPSLLTARDRRLNKVMKLRVRSIRP